MTRGWRHVTIFSILSRIIQHTMNLSHIYHPVMLMQLPNQAGAPHGRWCIPVMSRLARAVGKSGFLTTNRIGRTRTNDRGIVVRLLHVSPSRGIP